ncbi:hypothetical protein Goshw_029507 [Gossypium schwendimanii]|uniref:RNase H type-1 domain-containing protein n=1 Tax=Gossypium schwendimanii TaxID=34291 RepID=A0A7J9LZE9_GOSSC|nr:hypothetical protein [Gossypium schwendimanii]
MEDEVGCGGVLRDNKGVACALFFGLIEALGSEMVEIVAIKIALNYKPWTLQNLFIAIDCGINQLFRVQFTVIH